jgi:hypothetical protein
MTGKTITVVVTSSENLLILLCSRFKLLQFEYHGIINGIR